MTTIETRRQLLREYRGNTHAIIDDLVYETALLGALADGDAWKPIETAEPGMCIFRYENNGHPFATHGTKRDNGILEDHAEMDEQPTHWQPLPRPSIMPRPIPTLAALEAEHIRRVLTREPVIGRAAKILGINESTLWRKRRQLRIK